MSNSSHYVDYALFNILMRDDVPFVEGCIIKYVYRWRKKDGLKDLRKAKDCLDRLIAAEESRMHGEKIEKQNCIAAA